MNAKQLLADTLTAGYEGWKSRSKMGYARASNVGGCGLMLKGQGVEWQGVRESFDTRRG